jgi:hypothetical protein
MRESTAHAKIHVLWLKVDGDDQRYLEPRVYKISSGVAQPSRFSS